MISALDLRARTLKLVFDSAGRLGGSVLNLGLTRNLDLFADLSYGPHADQRLDVFRPKVERPVELPVLVFFHGGGWICADKKIYKGVAAAFAREGFLTFNVNYRLAPTSRFAAPLEDAALAIDWVFGNASRYGGDRSALILAGDSAGAQIASWYASAQHSKGLFEQVGVRVRSYYPPITGLLLFFGVYDFETVLDTEFPFIETYAQSFLGADPREYSKNSKLASPIKHVSPKLPPVWLCAGEDDGLFPQSKDYALALERCGVNCRKLFFPRGAGASHGFLFFTRRRCSREAVAAAVGFVREILRADSRRLAS